MRHRVRCFPPCKQTETFINICQDQFKHMNSELQKQADLLLSKWHQSAAARTKDMLSRLGILNYRPRRILGDSLIANLSPFELNLNTVPRYPDIRESWQDRSRLTRAMANAISTGNWNIKRFRIDRAGVSQAGREVPCH